MDAFTPEGIKFTLSPAGLPVRTLAYIIDVIFKFIIIIAVFIFWEIFFNWQFGFWIFLIINFCLDWFYHVICELAFHGQSLGKRLTGIRVVKSDGSPVDPSASFIRNLLRFADTFCYLFHIAFLSMTITAGFRRIGDWAGNTVVVYKQSGAFQKNPGTIKEQQFIQKRQKVWQDFSKLITDKKKELKKSSVSFLKMFREITQDLNTAKSCGFDSSIIDRLNTLVNEGNQIIYKKHSFPAKKIFNFILITFPQKVRAQRRGILAVMLLFYGLALFFAVLCIRFPGISEEIMSAYSLRHLEDMYNPESIYYLTPRDVSGDADMFGYYIYNNISIAFRTFASGILAGVGSLFILILNGGMLGIITGHLINTGFSKTLFSFTIAHSAFELTAIVFCAYAGLLLGYRFFVTKGLTRTASIKKAGEDALPIIAGSTIMLIIAAAIEAFWSSRHELPFQLRIAAGICMWILLLVYFLFSGAKNEPAA